MSKPPRKKRFTKQASKDMESEARLELPITQDLNDIGDQETALILSVMSSPAGEDEMSAAVNPEFNQLFRKVCANKDVAPPSVQISPVAPTNIVLTKSLAPKPHDTFEQMNGAPITPEMWLNPESGFGDLAALATPPPVFQEYIEDDMATHAVLAITIGPGLVNIPIASSYVGTWVVQLIPHSSLPANRLDEWQISDVEVIATLPINRALPKTSCKSKKGLAEKQKIVPTKVTKLPQSFAFDKNGRAVIDSIKLAASICQNVHLTFVCQVEWNGVGCSFSVDTAPFQVISNYNQWPGPFAACLEHAIFSAPHDTDAPLARCHNIVQLGYLQTKSFSQHRFLSMDETWQWIEDYCTASVVKNVDSALLAHDLHIAKTERRISRHMFRHWMASASKVFYDLHTTNFGKNFQSFWMSGFIGIGSKSTGTLGPGTARLFINTVPPTEEVGNPAASKFPLSYLSYKDDTTRFNLPEFDRAHLEHFLYHSRHSVDAVRLEHALEPNTYHLL